MTRHLIVAGHGNKIKNIGTNQNNPLHCSDIQHMLDSAIKFTPAKIRTEHQESHKNQITRLIVGN